MPSEPKKPIEEMLEASARARRADFGADSAMPNPMRARLHDEVARLEREGSEAKSRSRGFSIWWPRITIAAAATVLLVVASITWQRRDVPSGSAIGIATRERSATEAPGSPPLGAADSVSSLAGPAEKRPSDNQRPDEVPAAPAAEDMPAVSQPLNELAAAPAAKTAPLASDSRDELAEARLAEKSASVAGQPLSELAATTQSAGGSVVNAGKAETRAFEPAKAAKNTDSLKKFADVALAAPASETSSNWKNSNSERILSKGSVTMSGTLGGAGRDQKNAAANSHSSQRFSQNSQQQGARFNAKLKQAVNILSTFQVEQNGSQIRVVDYDGSTYTGKIEPLAQNDSRNVDKEQAKNTTRYAQAAPQLNKDGAASSNEFYFRATGYNSSLKKRLTFEGNYIVTAPQQLELHAKTDAAKNAEQTPARIVGTAKVGGEPPVQIDATSVGP